MISSSKLTVLSLACVAYLTPNLARADGREDFADALRASGGDETRPMVLTKLVTFKIGKKCWEKLADKTNDGVSSAAFFTRDVSSYAKRITTDDWSAIETQQAGDKKDNVKTVAGMIDAFKSKFSFTLINDGDDCDASASSLMLHYWTTVGFQLATFDAKAGKVNITLTMNAKSKDVTTAVNGANITINASSKIAVPGAEQKIADIFKKASKK